MSSPALALMPPHIMQAAYMRPPAPARPLRTAKAALLRAARGGDAMQQYKSVSRRCRARSARPDGAKRGRHCLVWTRLARSSQLRPTNGKVLAYRPAIDDATPSFDAAANSCEPCTPAAPPRTSLISSASLLMPAPE
eukprot:scaffold13326_cov127-Isochrysis_galbana.AAC.1